MRWRRLTAGPGLAFALLIGLTACGGGGDDDGGVASVDGSESEGDGGDESAAGDDGPGSQEEFQDAMLEYVECMRDHGIDMPDPEFGGDGEVMIGGPAGSGGGIGADGEPTEEMQAAQEECGPILEEAAPDMNLSPEEQAEMQDQMLQVAECMRARGHDMPDPQVDSSGRITVEAGSAGEPTEGGPGDDQFNQDMEQCNEEAGMRGPEDGPPGSEDDDGAEDED